MNILSRYVVRDFLNYFLLCLTALVLLVFVANTFGNIESIFRSWESLRNYLKDSGRSLPTVLEFTIPFSVLIATVITFTGFSRTFELVAMKSSGMGMTRLIVPILLVLIPVAGFTQGLLDSQPLGLAMLALAPMTLMTNVRELHLVESDLLPAIVLTVLATLVYETVIMVTLVVTGEHPDWLANALDVLVPAAIANALLLLPVYGLIRLASIDLRPHRAF